MDKRGQKWYRTAVTLRYEIERADEGARTLDLVLTMDALYQLSYVGADRRS